MNALTSTKYLCSRRQYGLPGEIDIMVADEENLHSPGTAAVSKGPDNSI
jgi:hypothetical protein